MERASLRVGDDQISYLTAGDGPIVLLLHGTYWSRVWAPVIDLLAERGLRPVAVDLPGCGRSGGRLTLESATVPRLAGWVDAFLDALGAGSTVLVAGHDIGGAITQQLAVHGRRECCAGRSSTRSATTRGRCPPSGASVIRRWRTRSRSMSLSRRAAAR